MSIDDIGVVAFLVAIPASWYWIVRRLREKGRGVFFRLGAALVMSPLAGLACFALITDPAPGVVFFAVIFGPLYLMTRRNGHQAAAEQRPSVDAATATSEPIGFKLSETARAIYESDDGIDSPLAQWNAAAPRKSDMSGVDAPGLKSIVHGKKLDVIRFDYRNAKNELAARRVKVTMIGQWQFEGIDLVKRAERTFRHDRVIGDITSELTGEVLSPGDWAMSIIDRSE